MTFLIIAAQAGVPGFEHYLPKTDAVPAVPSVAGIKEDNAGLVEGVLNSAEGAAARVSRAAFNVLDRDF